MRTGQLSFAAWIFWTGAIALGCAGIALWARHLPFAANPGMAAATQVLPGLLAGSAAVFFGVAGISRGYASRKSADCHAAWSNFTRLGVQIPANRRHWLGVSVGCLLMVLAFDLQGFVHGIFRLDDFEYLRVVRQESVAHQIFLPHGGHSIPLLRLEMLLLAAGPAPSPAVFNLVNLASCVAVLIAGCWLLGELGVGWLGLAAFVGLNWSWTGWGDFTSGYFCLMNVLQGLALGFAALAALVRAATTGKKFWLGLSLACAGVAVCIGLANVWIFPALLAMGAVVLRRAESRLLIKPFVIGFTGVALAFAAYNIAAFRHGEFLGNPGGGAVDGFGLARSLLSGVGGVILNLFIPVQPGSLNTGGIIYALEIGALVIGVWLAVRVTRDRRSLDRPILLALAATLLVQIAMIAVARRPALAGFFWPAKWTAMAHCTLAILIAWGLDRHLRTAVQSGGVAPKWIAAAALIGASVTLSAPTLLDAMGSPVSRASNVDRAIERRSELQRFTAGITQLSELLNQRPLRLPPCPTERLFAEFPALENYPMGHIASALPAHLLQVEPGPRSLTPAERAALARIPSLDRLYPRP